MNNCQQRTAVVVEEESPQEFYANLLGTRPRPPPPPKKNAAKHDGRRLMMPRDNEQPPSLSSSSLPVMVPPEKETLAVPSNDVFNQVYYKAIQDPLPQNHMSALSLNASNCNRGFRLLAQMGWKEEDGGLGKRRQGTLIPIKTRIKSNKRGLGGREKCKEEEDTQLRVTHQPHKNVNNSVLTSAERRETKAQRRRRKQREREMDQNAHKRIRMMLRTDVRDDYEELYMSLHGR